MNSCAFTVAIWVLSALVGPLDPADSEAFRARFREVAPLEARRPREAVMCGPNVLYLFLRAHNQSVVADRFFREVEPSDYGLALTELRDASTRNGLRAEIRRCTYAELISRCTFPLVALLATRRGSDQEKDGHYVLVLDADTKGVTVVDGTSGEQNYLCREKFCRQWKGYVIVPAMSQIKPLLLVGSTIPLWLLVGWLVLRLARLNGRAG